MMADACRQISEGEVVFSDSLTDGDEKSLGELISAGLVAVEEFGFGELPKGEAIEIDEDVIAYISANVVLNHDEAADEEPDAQADQADGGNKATD